MNDEGDQTQKMFLDDWYITILCKQDKIIAEIYLSQDNEHGKCLKTFKEQEALPVYTQILENYPRLSYNHKTYLLTELSCAEKCIENGIIYTQDRTINEYNFDEIAKIWLHC